MQECLRISLREVRIITEKYGPTKNSCFYKLCSILIPHGNGNWKGLSNQLEDSELSNWKLKVGAGRRLERNLETSTIVERLCGRLGKRKRYPRKMMDMDIYTLTISKLLLIQNKEISSYWQLFFWLGINLASSDSSRTSFLVKEVFGDFFRALLS